MVRPSSPSPFDDAVRPPAADGGGAPAGLAEVAVNAPLDRLFHYRVPEALRERLRIGHRVLVPFGRRSATGVCVGFPARTEREALKPIQEILLPECRFDEHLLALTRWIAEYYVAGWGEVLEAALPPGVRAPRREKKREAMVIAARPAAELEAEALRLERRAGAQARLLRALAAGPGPRPLAALLRDLPATRDAARKLEARGLIATLEEPAGEESGRPPGGDDVRAPELLPRRGAPSLHADQERALALAIDIVEGRRGRPPPPLLLHGVTGSGKTEVYLRALEHVLRGGGRGLVLVPEISLTPQTVRRFHDGLPGVAVAVLHSMLSPRQRAEAWRAIQGGRIGVVIGARSAVFAPVPDLRLIVVDEEHEPSYKQESSPRYHGRDVAVLRARLLGIAAILGSATPSLESYQNARGGKYLLAEMPRRATEHDLPSVAVLPLGPEFYRADGGGTIAPQLDFQIRKCLERKEQVLLFLNRRGFSTFLHCVRCGHVLHCDHCDIALTYHQRDDEARCHYCDARYAPPADCPECRFPALRRSGVGTEKVAELLARRYEGARILRMDRDTVRSRESLESILDRFGKGEADILVGTQMIAKGHDFPGVSLVGILSADTGLHFPDFRAAERTFQTITQVAGRAGRGGVPGRVLVQTFFPENYSIRAAVAGSFAEFFTTEIEHRRALGYPPFGRLAKVLIQDAKPERAEACARKLRDRIEEAAKAALAAGGRAKGLEVLGPAPAPIRRIQERHRFQILIKAAGAGLLRELLRRASIHDGGRLAGEVTVDVDPQSML
jgi:primosomal protein N' (replication factor Y)